MAAQDAVGKGTQAKEISGHVKGLLRGHLKSFFGGVSEPGRQPGAVLFDVARTLIVYESMSEMAWGVLQLAAAEARGEVTILRTKLRFEEPTAAGWADLMCNVVLHPVVVPVSSARRFRRMVKGRVRSRTSCEGHVCEIQFVHRKLMLVRSQMGGHTLYDSARYSAELLEATGNLATAATVVGKVPDLFTRLRMEYIIPCIFARLPAKVLTAPSPSRPVGDVPVSHVVDLLTDEEVQVEYDDLPFTLRPSGTAVELVWKEEGEVSSWTTISDGLHSFVAQRTQEGGVGVREIQRVEMGKFTNRRDKVFKLCFVLATWEDVLSLDFSELPITDADRLHLIPVIEMFMEREKEQLVPTRDVRGKWQSATQQIKLPMRSNRVHSLAVERICSRQVSIEGGNRLTLQKVQEGSQ